MGRRPEADAEEPVLILVDSSVWIDYLNARRGLAGDELDRLIQEGAPLVLTGLVVTEVLQGLRRDHLSVARGLALWPLIEPEGFALYVGAAGLYRAARQRGITLSTVDVVLAALAIEHDADLFTTDSDFEGLRFAGLKLWPFREGAE